MYTQRVSVRTVLFNTQSEKAMRASLWIFGTNDLRRRRNQARPASDRRLWTVRLLSLRVDDYLFLM